MFILEQITQAQRKIIFAAVIDLSVFILFLSLIYMPSRRKVAKLKAELQSIEQEVAEIKKIASQAGSLEKSITLFKDRYSVLQGKFPAKEEEAISKISDLARQLRINIISLKPGAKQVVFSEGKEGLAIEQKVCHNILVAIEMDCTYAELVKYLELLNEELPALVTVETIEIANGGPVTPGKLRVNLSFNLYLLS